MISPFISLNLNTTFKQSSTVNIYVIALANLQIWNYIEWAKAELNKVHQSPTSAYAGKWSSDIFASGYTQTLNEFDLTY